MFLGFLFGSLVGCGGMSEYTHTHTANTYTYTHTYETWQTIKHPPTLHVQEPLHAVRRVRLHHRLRGAQVPNQQGHEAEEDVHWELLAEGGDELDAVRLDDGAGVDVGILQLGEHLCVGGGFVFGVLELLNVGR